MVARSGWRTEEDRAHGGSLGRLHMVYFTPAYSNLVQISNIDPQQERLGNVI